MCPVWGTGKKLDEIQNTLSSLTDKINSIENKLDCFVRAHRAFAKELEDIAPDSKAAAIIPSTAFGESGTSVRQIKGSQEAANILEEKITALQAEKANAEEEIKDLKAEIENQSKLLKDEQAAKALLGEDLQKAEKRNENLADQNKKLAEKLSTAELESRTKRAQVDELKKLQLPKQEKLAAIWEKLSRLPQEEKNIAAAYYDLSSLDSFLAGAGQFANLEQLWDASAKKIRDGIALPEMGQFMELLMDIYNSANKTSLAKIETTETGVKYDYMKQDRIGRNGDAVGEMLLPGITMPNGNLAKKSLVILK